MTIRGPKPTALDFGSIPTRVQPEAEELLRRLPGRSLFALLTAIRQWVESQTRVKSASITAVSEPEGPGWTEVIVQLAVDADSELALRLWDDLAGSVDEVKARLSPEDKALFDERFGVHMVWGEDNDRRHPN